MPSLNQVQLIGYLGQEVEVKTAQSGNAFCTLSVATDESYKDRDGNWIKRAEWHRVAVFGRQAEYCGKYLHKGNLVYVEGSLATRKWTNKQGQDQYTTEIKAIKIQGLEKPENNGNSGNNQSRGSRQPEPEINYDDVPF